VREKGIVHPDEVDRHFGHGRVTGYWGGASNASTHLLAAMHYQGMLRVVGRDAGIRLYSVHDHGSSLIDNTERDARLDALVDAVMRVYAPMPVGRLRSVGWRLRYAAPQWQRAIPPALRRAEKRLPHAKVDGVEWYWPEGESLKSATPPEAVRLLAPFDPVVWDRDRFERLWGWTYRFEAYTPALKRIRGYYALPMLWRDRVIGWANLTVSDGELHADFGYVGSAPKDLAFVQELEAEIERIRSFLGLSSSAQSSD
jgi:uncharacterized protein YcaQ